MTTKTFTAEVNGGLLKHDESLASLEGQRVRVTVEPLIADESRNGVPAASPTAEPAAEIAPCPQVIPIPPFWDESMPDDLGEPPEGVDVERDVFIQIPHKWEPMKGVLTIIDGGPMKPCIILPEEIPDDDYDD